MREIITQIIILTLGIEILTIAGRLLFGSAKKVYSKIKFRHKIRIHHGYIGILLLIIYCITTNDLLILIGAALALSDAIHHFIILPVWIGKTEFP